MTDDMTNKTSRREFLGKTSAVVAGGIAAGQTDSTDVAASPATDESKFQPEAFWKERMTPPDDGKMLGWLVDTRRCFGCHACEVSCKSENDVPLGKFIRQTIYKDVGEYPKVARVFLQWPVSIAKMHLASRRARVERFTKKSAEPSRWTTTCVQATGRAQKSVRTERSISILSRNRRSNATTVTTGSSTTWSLHAFRPVRQKLSTLAI